MMIHDLQIPDISWRGILNCPEASLLSPTEEREILVELVDCRRCIIEAVAEPDCSEWCASTLQTDFQQVVRDVANLDMSAEPPIVAVRQKALRYQELRSKLAMANVRL